MFFAHTLQRRTQRHRRGAVVVLTAILMVFLISAIALVVDLGYLYVGRAELQRSADSAALAAASALIDQEALTGRADMSNEISLCRTNAVAIAAANYVRNNSPVVNSNTANSASGDVVVGYLSNPSNPSLSIDTSQMDKANAVKVTVRRTSDRNGEIGLFFARIMGIQSKPLTASATAAIVGDIRGFQSPSDGSNLGILPITLHVDSWNDLINGHGVDRWEWDDTNGVSHHRDNILELNLYPESTSSPGNVGTVDIGSSSNSTSDIARQILDGVSPDDLSHMPNERIELNSNGELQLNGDTGISASIQNELHQIRGQPRMIPLYRTVVNPGDNAQYTIVAFVGVRIMDVDLTGALKNKRVTIQPAQVKTKGGISGGGSNSSTYIHSGVWLVR
jgi:Flp pilus assembly protein TadG